MNGKRDIHKESWTFNLSFIRPNGNVGFTVTGLNEMIRSLDAMGREIPTVRTAVLNEGARFLVNEAKRNVHVVSGRLKASISIETQTSNFVVVSAKTPYAAIENLREGTKSAGPKTRPPYGPHNYWTTAVASLQKIWMTRIKVNFDKLWQKHKRF